MILIDKLKSFTCFRYGLSEITCDGSNNFHPDDNIEWTLEAKIRKKEKFEGVINFEKK
jgi:hypothetical protein